ncbi:MAG: Polysaccharide pyruvyl transferase [Syntrophorhabdaceae bacterium PtaU1.Bin034]|jgi:polysaccharide pyruvyl transferase CsaB|nr:MAG: Polysaccharide pyruvyl transferase [Syntrophorhabdaceae bacterium PtaU1.Bin034]
METARPYRVAISGSYGGMNLGDEAILQCIVTELRNSLPVEITVFTRDPEDTLRRHRVERAIPVRKLSRDEVLPEIERLDLLILGGGGILFDGEVRQYLRELALAHEKSVPVMTYAIGAGPLHDPVNQKLVRENLDRAALVTVRERSAKSVLEDAGVSHDIIITADPALLLQPEPLPPDSLQCEGLEGRERLIGVSVREPGLAAPDINQDSYHALLANASDYMVDRYDAHVVFVPMERKVLDMQHSHAVISQMLRPQKASVVNGNYTSGQMLSLINQFMFAVGMRLHFLIFAALTGVPFVALPYASKVFGFLEDLKIEMPPLTLVNSGRLIAYIDKSWDTYKLLKEQISAALPSLFERARETNRLTVSLLKQIGVEKGIQAETDISRSENAASQTSASPGNH